CWILRPSPNCVPRPRSTSVRSCVLGFGVMSRPVFFPIRNQEKILLVAVHHVCTKRHEIIPRPNDICFLSVPDEHAMCRQSRQLSGIQFERHASWRSFANAAFLSVRVKPSTPQASDFG